MRWSALDVLRDRHDNPLTVIEKAAVECCSPEGWLPCKTWCGRHAVPAAAVDRLQCRECLCEEVTEGTLAATEHGEVFPIFEGIPRLVRRDLLAAFGLEHPAWFARHGRSAEEPGRVGGNHTEKAVRDVLRSFEFEWERFSAFLPEFEAIFQKHFSLVEPDKSLGVCLDAGCGCGRWAYYAKNRCETLWLADGSRAIDVAKKNLNGAPNLHFAQCDVRQMPFSSGTFDFIYCLGVLPYVPDVEETFVALGRPLKSGGQLLTYHYYALDNRPAYYRWLFGMANTARLGISKLPKRLAQAACWMIACFVYVPLVQLSRGVSHLLGESAARQVPLSEYRGRPFYILYTDSFDRFASPIENRATSAEMIDLYSRNGFDAVRVSDTAAYWKTIGTRR